MLGNILGGLALGGLQLLGGNAANRTNMAIANAQMAFQDESQQKSMDFAERMSNTSYQRGMADMRAAGLNPILAYGQGGATAPTVGVQAGASTRVDNVLGSAASSAFQGAQAITQLEQMAAQVEQTREATNLLRADQYYRAAQTVSEHDRPQLLQAQSELERLRGDTERERPGQVRAQTATERERPAQVQAETRGQSARALGQEQENVRFHNYGPRGTVPDSLASAEAIARRGYNTPLGQEAGTRLQSYFGRFMDILR